MFRNYFKIAFRNLSKNKVSSFINISGLAIGMMVAMLIGLWIWDELSFNKYHQKYDRIVQVKQSQRLNDEVRTQDDVPMPLAPALRNSYGASFKHVILSTTLLRRALTYNDKKFMKQGRFMEPAGPGMLTLNMLKGTAAGLNDPSSVFISESAAKAFFINEDPIDKIIKIDSKVIAKVTGVYEDLPHNSEFADMEFVAPWTLYISSEEWLKEAEQQWDNNSAVIYAELSDQADVAKVSQLIRDERLNNSSVDMKKFKPEIFVYPMSKWHLFSEFKNGVSVGGRIQFVWLFGIIGMFVLILACINFINLSTAQSMKRAKEVGVRKAIGSLRRQLIQQFLSESLMITAFSFVVSLLLLLLILPWFNKVADKNMSILWSNVLFWVLGVSFTILTGLIAGSYPAFYLSSFDSVKALKGTFRVGKLASLPRKILVAVQFTVSIVLIIGTVIVFRQIQHGKDRPVGYSRNGLVLIDLATTNIHDHFSAIRNDLLKTRTVIEMSESSSPTTEVWNEQTGFDWKDKPPGLSENFITIGINHEYGKSVGWQFAQGRDYSRELATDSLAFVINESAAKFMGLKNPVGETVRWQGTTFKIIGVIKNMVIKSPFDAVTPTIFYISPWPVNVVNIRLNPNINASVAMDKIQAVFSEYYSALPLDYKFVDDEYNAKFSAEERIGKLASVFAILAILISCLGLFGLASFVAVQRTKEIGVRKVLGASVFNLWQMLSKDFVVLVFISCFIAIPIAWHFLHQWLQKYEYRTQLSWWIFAAGCLAALIITSLTVSYQAIRAAVANPVKSLKTE